MQMMLKRVIDVAASGVGLLLAAPLAIIAGVAIRSTMGSPILFCQSRPGHGGRLFTCRRT
ncbi:MAG TPA: sugar transferase [Methylomirabilota bacterium]|jgi:lipopolysaccharide/colanic/teichoic acid biosynthesis glycosyltransferase